MRQFLYEMFIRYCWTTEFQKGATVAGITIFSLILLYALLRLLLSLRFGRQRCAEITVEQEHGRIVIAKDAIEAALRCELERFRELSVRKIVLFKYKQSYQLEIYAAYNNGESEANLVGLFAGIRPMLLEKMHSFFGVDSLEDLALKVERFSNDPLDFDDAGAVNSRIPDFNVPTQRR